jgi:renalase
MPPKADIAIIGAGVSGLAAAHTLQDAGHRVTLFEQSDSVGGRATTRRRDGFTYDHGAQYIKRGNPQSVAFITERFHAPDLIDISKPVWIFDGAGHIQEGDPVQNAEPKWCYRSGLITLAQRMAEGLELRLNTSIAHIQQDTTGWTLFDTSGQSVGRFAQVLISIPAIQAADLVQASQLPGDLRSSISSRLQTARYNPLISVMLGYRPQPIAPPYYALVNTDRAHAISWLAWEHEKSPERVPPGCGLLLAQMAPQYSQDHQHTPDADIIRDAARLVTALIGEPLPTPFFTDIQRWPYALPSTRADADVLNAIALPHGLAFCGDAFVGGRVHLALEHGIIVAHQLLKGHI